MPTTSPDRQLKRKPKFDCLTDQQPEIAAYLPPLCLPAANLTAPWEQRIRLSTPTRDFDIGGQQFKRQEFAESQVHSRIYMSSSVPPTAPEILPLPENFISQTSLNISYQYNPSYRPPMGIPHACKPSTALAGTALSVGVDARSPQGPPHRSLACPSKALSPRRRITPLRRARCSPRSISLTEKQDEDEVPNDLNATNEEKAKAREQVQALLAKWTTLGSTSKLEGLEPGRVSAVF